MSEQIPITISEIISEKIKQYIESTDNPEYLRVLVADLCTLPLLLDMGGCYGIRPNGDIICFSYDNEFESYIETDQRIHNIALYQGIIKYPELKELLPVRPPNAKQCEYCKGSGLSEPKNDPVYKSIICYCGGLGWIPE
jgi:hypothetical protein